MAEAGYELEWVELPLARIFRYLKSGRIDFWMTSPNIPQLKGDVVAGQSTVAQLALTVYHRPDTPHVQSVEDLGGERLIKVVGMRYLNLLDGVESGDEDAASAPDHRSALAMLTFGRGDYLLDYDAVIDPLKPEFPDLNVHANALRSLRIAFVVSRQTPDAEQVARRLDAAYQKLKEDGELSHRLDGYSEQP